VSLGIVKAPRAPLPTPAGKQPAGFVRPVPKLVVATVYRPKGD
jgi:hypothetical protein